MIDTYTFKNDGRSYIHFMKYDTEDFLDFVQYIEKKLNIVVDGIDDLVMAYSASFNFNGIDYVAVSGGMDTCHIVAPDEDSRGALLNKIFGPNVDWELHKIKINYSENQLR